MMKLIIMPGPAFWAAVAVSTKIPVPMTAPMPSRVSWKAPSERLSDFFSAVARMASRDFTRPEIMSFTFADRPQPSGGILPQRTTTKKGGRSLPFPNYEGPSLRPDDRVAVGIQRRVFRELRKIGPSDAGL